MLGPRAAFGSGVGVFPELLLRARIAAGPRWSLGLDLEIPTLPGRISAAEGSAALSYGAALAAADLRFELSDEDRLRLGGGLGPLLLWIDGSAAPGYLGQAETLTAFAAELSVAYGRRLGPLWLSFQKTHYLLGVAGLSLLALCLESLLAVGMVFE